MILLELTKAEVSAILNIRDRIIKESGDEYLTYYEELHTVFADVASSQNLSWMAVRDDYYSDDSIYKQDIDSQMERTP
jgi:hypothetical protein